MRGAMRTSKSTFQERLSAAACLLVVAGCARNAIEHPDERATTPAAPTVTAMATASATDAAPPEPAPTASAVPSGAPKKPFGMGEGAAEREAAAIATRIPKPLNALLAKAAAVCKNPATIERSPSPAAGTDLDKDASVLEVVVTCSEVKKTGPNSVMERPHSFLPLRGSLADSVTPDISMTMRVEMDNKIYARCPSRRIDDDMAMDFEKVAAYPGGEMTVVVAVRSKVTCLSSDEQAANEGRRKEANRIVDASRDLLGSMATALSCPANIDNYTTPDSAVAGVTKRSDVLAAAAYCWSAGTDNIRKRSTIVKHAAAGQNVDWSNLSSTPKSVLRRGADTFIVVKPSRWSDRPNAVDLTLLRQDKGGYPQVDVILVP